MVVVVQLVRTPDCGSGGRRFESGLPPKNLEQIFALTSSLRQGFLFKHDVLRLHSLFQVLRQILQGTN